MKIHCPHCLSETELEHSVADSVIRCSACGSVFDPRKKETLPNAAQDTSARAGAAAPQELLPGICAGDGFGGYVLERRLGKGGMGVVFEATQVSLGRKVALKVLAHDLLKDPEFVRRFDREARVLAQLSHPHIVQVIDKGIERGNVFLVMELVEGVSLRDLMAERKIKPHEAMKLIPQLCDALEYAHERGVVHRDVKPENILVGKDGTVKIADFGLARIVGEGPSGRITKSNAVMGSLDYMAPEQREKTRDADHRADIYALGVVFYELLTGELPIGRFEPPGKRVKLEVDVDEVVLKILSKDPEMRYQRASEVGAELRRRSGVQAAGVLAAGIAGSPATAPATSPGPAPLDAPANDIDGLMERWAEAPLPARIGPLAGATVLSLVLLEAAITNDQRAPALFAGSIIASVMTLAIRLRLASRIDWRPGWGTLAHPEKPGKRFHWPRPLGALAVIWILTAIFLPEPVDALIVPILLAFGMAVHSQSPRLFRFANPLEVPTMPRSPLPPALQQDLAHLGHGAPAAAFAPAAPPRPRMSFLAIVGFLASCAAFVLGTGALAVTSFVHDAGFAVLDDSLDEAGTRRGIEAAISGALNTTEIAGGLALVSTIALTAGVLLLAFNGGVFFSVGRKVGVRGAGFAFMGGLLTAISMLEVVGVASTWKREIDLARPGAWMGDPRRVEAELVEAQTNPSLPMWLKEKLDGDVRMHSRYERLLTVAELSRLGPVSLSRISGIAKEDPSPAVRYAATFALGLKAASSDATVRDRAKAALAEAAKDPRAEVRAVAAWGLSDPATRGEPTPAPVRVRYKNGREYVPAKEAGAF